MSTRVLELLSGVGALVRGSHLIYTSGRHGADYVNKDALYPHTRLVSEVCFEIAKAFVGRNVEVVVGPVVGGVVLSQWVAHHLSELESREVLSVYAEKAEQGFVLKRGYDEIVHERATLVVEDILNTGGSARAVVELLYANHADVVGVGALCNRGAVTAEQLGLRANTLLFSAAQISLESWEADKCPLCEKKIPINTSLGKGAKSKK